MLLSGDCVQAPTRLLKVMVADTWNYEKSGRGQILRGQLPGTFRKSPYSRLRSVGHSKFLPDVLHFFSLNSAGPNRTGEYWECFYVGCDVNIFNLKIPLALSR